MKSRKLTRLSGPATGRRPTHKARTAGAMTMRTGLWMAAALGLGGCININAPDEAIVIELNIDIRQEVIYRLAEDAADTIDENADIF